MTSAYLPGPEHAASTSGQTGVVCAFMIQSNEIVIHVHASVASRPGEQQRHDKEPKSTQIL